MNTKKVNWLFFIIVISHVGLSLLVAFVPFMGAALENMALNIFVSEITIWLPTILFLLASKTNPVSFCRLKRVHISTVLMTVLYTLLLEPLITVVNAVTTLFVDNTVAGMSGQIIDLPLWMMLLGVAVYAPFAEELAFRGVIYQGYRGQGNGWKALLLSSLLFGLMHMNLNQACYAFVMGVALALLMEATGSMLPAFIVHFCINGLSTVLMYAMDGMTGGQLETLMDTAESSVSTQEMLLVICVYVLIATLCTPLAGCVLVWVAGREGRREELRQLWRSRRNKTRLVSIPLALGMLICVAVIVLQIVWS
ncbi:MAG: CPBP family intramembrane metalloprotease [bacterium]|nr:CPBP family intramembrane metalloprotease [bacterium]MCM1374418.1 CPBP family intramembrane metalloprotease [Muribaculum sp.]